MTRKEALDVYRRHGLLLAQFTVREDVAARLVELERAEQHAREEQGRQRDRLQAIVAERLSPREPLPTDALVTIIERELAATQRTQEHWRQHAEHCERWMREAQAERDAAVGEASRLRALLRSLESCVVWSDSTQTWGLYQRVRDVLGPVRAALATAPEPAPGEIR